MVGNLHAWWANDIHGGEPQHMPWPAFKNKKAAKAGQATMYLGSTPCIWVPHHAFGCPTMYVGDSMLQSFSRGSKNTQRLPTTRQQAGTGWCSAEPSLPASQHALACKSGVASMR